MYLFFCSVTKRRRMEPGDKDVLFMDKIIVILFTVNKQRSPV